MRNCEQTESCNTTTTNNNYDYDNNKQAVQDDGKPLLPRERYSVQVNGFQSLASVAAQSGIVAGDVIRAVNGTLLVNMSYDDSMRTITAAAGARPLTLTVLRVDPSFDSGNGNSKISASTGAGAGGGGGGGGGGAVARLPPPDPDDSQDLAGARNSGEENNDDDENGGGGGGDSGGDSDGDDDGGAPAFADELPSVDEYGADERPDRPDGRQPFAASSASSPGNEEAEQRRRVNELYNERG